MPDPRPQSSTSSLFAANSISMRTSSISNSSAVATAGGNGTASARRVRRSWTPAEDHALRTRVALYGDARGSEGRWKDIACGVPGRTAKVGRLLVFGTGSGLCYLHTHHRTVGNAGFTLWILPFARADGQRTRTASCWRPTLALVPHGMRLPLLSRGAKMTSARSGTWTF